MTCYNDSELQNEIEQNSTSHVNSINVLTEEWIQSDVGACDRSLEIQKKMQKFAKCETAIEKFYSDIKQLPNYICTCCRRLLYRRSMNKVSDLNTEVTHMCITGKKSVNDIEWICSTCLSYVKKDKIPPQANCNLMEVFPQPEVLKKLTTLERRLVSRRIPFMKLLALPKGKQSGIKGSVVNVPVSEDAVCSSLPRTPTDAGLIPLRLKRKIAYKSHYSFQYIRPNVVMEAASWLKENNHLYQSSNYVCDWIHRCNVEDSELWKDLTQTENNSNNLSSELPLPMEITNINETQIPETEDEDGQIQSGTDIHGIDNKVGNLQRTESRQNQNVQGRYEQVHGNEYCNSKIKTMEVHNIQTENNQDNVEDDYTEDPVSKLRGVQFDICIQQTDPAATIDNIINISPGEGKRPISILMDEHFEEYAFPHLLPNGKFGWNYTRPIKLSAKKYFQQRLLNEQQTFAADIEYLFVALSITEAKQIFDSMNIALRKSFKSTSDNQNITAEIVRNSETLQSCIFRDEGYRFLKPVRGSPPYWQKVQYKLLAAIKQLGIFTWFFTLSAADLKWIDTIQAIASQRGTTFSQEDITNMSWEEKCSWLRSNPVTAARHFQYRLDSLMKNLVLSDAKPLGHVRHFFYRIEFQQRGSPHAHGVLWIKDAPNPEESEPEEIEKFISMYVSAELPSQDKQKDLYDLVNQVQRHTHSASCRKSGKSCRFNFPKPITPKTIVAKPRLDQDNDLTPQQVKYKQQLSLSVLACVKEFLSTTEDIHLLTTAEIFHECGITEEQYIDALKSSVKDVTVFMKRSASDIFINNYSPAILHAWQANMDIQFVSNAYACIQYVVAYVTKDEREMGTLLQAVSKEAAEQSIKQQMKKCAKSFQDARSVSAQEAVYRVLGLPLHKSDFQTVWIPTGMPHQRVRLLKPKYLLEKMESDEENIFVTGLEEKYAGRPPSLENWSLALFASVFTVKQSSCNTESDIQPDLQLQEQVQEQSIQVEVDVNSAPDTIRIQTKCDTFTMKKRSKQAMIRYHKFSTLKDPDSYYYSELYLYIPWRTEDQLLGRYDSYKEHYEDVLQQITSAKTPFQHHACLIENTIEEFIENGPRDTEWDLLAPETEQERMDDAACTEEVDPQYEILNPDQLDEEEVDNVPVETTMTHCPISSDSSVPTLLPEDEYLNIVRSLNVKQRQLFQVVLDWSNNLLIGHGKQTQIPFNYFITGGAGTGKSHLIKALHQMVIRTLRREGDDPTTLKVLLTAPTGTAAHNINGLTIHSALQMQLGQGAKSSYHRLGDEKRNTLRCKYSQLRLIIIDEISMVGSDLLLQIHRRLQEIFQSSSDFGGISILAFGDLYQLPPVCQKFVFQPPSDEYAQLCVQLWDNFKLFELTEVMRQQGDAPFANLLNRVRDGTHNVDDITTLNTRNTCSPLSILHIFATNAQVDNYNRLRLGELPGQIICINSIDVVPETLKNRKIPEDQRFTGGLTSVLQLKLGCRIMLTRNLDVADGLSNGAQGTLTGILKNANSDQVKVLMVKFDTERIGHETRIRSKYDLNPFPNYSTPVERTEASFSLSKTKKNVSATRKQFPIRLCWACTVHKIQGQSLDEVFVSFEGRFSDGQAYVALSRARSLNGLHLNNFDNNKIKVSKLVQQEMGRLRQSSLLHIPLNDFSNERSGENVIISCLNARSAKKHMPDIILDPAFSNADIICICESNIRQSDFHQINGYNCHELFMDNQTKIHGLLLYVKSAFPSEIKRSTSTETFELLEVSVQKNTVSFNVVLLYRSPSSLTSAFTENLSDLFPTSNRSTSFVLGDFNVNEKSMPAVYNRLIQHFHTIQYIQCIKHATTVYGSTLDLLFANSAIPVDVHISGTYYSDHAAVVLQAKF
jgi:hypothetical protein